jgi:hypothetical protein
MAAALGLAPGTLAERMNGSTDGDYAIQDELKQYEVIARRAADAQLADGAYCAAVEPAYRKMATAVESNLNALDDRFPRAAAAYLDIWIDYALQASDYARRTVVVMHFPSAAAGKAEIANLRSTYAHDVHDEIIGGVSSELHNEQQTIASMLRGDPGLIEGQRDIECARAPVNPNSPTEALEDLLKAAEAATEFGAEFHSPDCNLEIGDFKISCKPLAFEGVKVGGKGPIRPLVSTEGGHFRYGVDGSAGTLGSEGDKTNVTEANMSDSAYGVEASVGISTWVEANATGGADVYVGAKGDLGAGVDPLPRTDRESAADRRVSCA